MPNEKAAKAEAMYHDGMKLVDIARKLDVPPGTVRRWKSTYHWDGNSKKKQNERSDNKSERSDKSETRHRGGQIGNNNALKNATYASEYWKNISDEERAMMADMPTDEELNGGIVGYGLSNIVCAFFGGLPTATYSQNVGIVGSTKVVAKRVFETSAIIILIAGLIPKFSSVLTTIPYCVLGGATVSVFASIAMTGIKLITTAPMDFRNTTVVGLSIALGMGVTQANAALATFPAWVTTIFGKSPVVLATITAVFLNLVLPKNSD